MLKVWWNFPAATLPSNFNLQYANLSCDTNFRNKMSTAVIRRPRVFLDVSHGEQPLGRLVIELFIDKTPKTCEKYLSFFFF